MPLFGVAMGLVANIFVDKLVQARVQLPQDLTDEEFSRIAGLSIDDGSVQFGEFFILELLRSGKIDMDGVRRPARHPLFVRRLRGISARRPRRPPASAAYPRGVRGGSAIRLRGLSARHPRRRRDSPPRNIRAAPAAAARFASAAYPRGVVWPIFKVAVRAQVHKIKKAFDLIDESGDGTLSPHEVRRFHKLCALRTRYSAYLAKEKKMQHDFAISLVIEMDSDALIRKGVELQWLRRADTVDSSGIDPASVAVGVDDEAAPLATTGEESC